MPSEAVVERFRQAVLAAWNEGKFDAIDEFISPNFVRHQPPFPDIVGPEAYKKYTIDTRQACPDEFLWFDKIIVQGDWTVFKGGWRGTWNGTGSLLPDKVGIGQKLDFLLCNASRWEGDQWAEEFSHNDFLGMMLQTGLIKWYE